MSAVYPTALKKFINKIADEDFVQAEDTNDLQDELAAVQEYLGSVNKTNFISLNTLLSDYRKVEDCVLNDPGVDGQVNCPAQEIVIDTRGTQNTAQVTRDITTDIPSPSVATTYYVYAVDDGDGTFSLKFRTSAADNFAAERKIASVVTEATDGTILVSIADDDGAQAPLVKVVTYVGNATDDRSIAVGFQPDFVFVQVRSGHALLIRSPVTVGDESVTYAGITSANQIQQFEPNGFQIGSNNAVNFNSGDIWALCFKFL